ncbi:MAG: hypothetical protein P0S96_05695 [Simkaniaceae bacterium]|nr:hypothetical protein [Candidatus Sacchlamyda saccharinae]
MKLFKIKNLLLSLLFFPLCCFGKVYDCFPFFNELELLEIRLHELNDVVDYFVLVESTETQRGGEKPLFFLENKERFAPYLHKVIHIILDERHPEFEMWDREHYQRNEIMRGLNKCKNRDIILISDLDEIPRGLLIPHIKPEMKRRSIPTINFQMHQYRFHLNRRHLDDFLCDGTVATTFAHLKQSSPQYVRDKRSKTWSFKNAGWHFTWMGGRERVRTKMQSVVEGTDEIVTDESIDAMIQSVPALPIDHTFPRYVQEHEEELRLQDFVAKETLINCFLRDLSQTGRKS